VSPADLARLEELWKNEAWLAARDWLDRYLQEAPQDDEARHALVRTLLRIGDADALRRAASEISQLVSSLP
jgi:thioredoxin-like negative regulator of GroEL